MFDFIAKKLSGRINDLKKWDKVIFMVLLGLMMYSLLAIFTSSSYFIYKGIVENSRIEEFWNRLKWLITASSMLLLIQFIPNIKWIKTISKWTCFIIPFILLVLLAIHQTTHQDLGFIRFPEKVRPYRSINIYGINVLVSEVAKFCSVFYFAWVASAWEKKNFRLANFLAEHFENLRFLGKERWQSFIFIFLPFFSLLGLTFLTGTSNAVILFFIILFTLFIGEFPLGKIFLYIVYIFLIGSTGYLAYRPMHEIYKDRKLEQTPKVYRLLDTIYGRFHNTGLNRIGRHKISFQQALENAKDEAEKKYLCDKYEQSQICHYAIKEGGIFGKMAGNSTQKYRNRELSNDYIFSILVEEYGLLFGAIPLILLYLSLFARGAIVANCCQSIFASSIVGGLCFYITGQAFLHIMVNIGLITETGQSLPLISRGNTSLFITVTAFGILLYISKEAKRQIEKASVQAGSLAQDAQDTINDLDEMENQLDNN